MLRARRYVVDPRAFIVRPIIRSLLEFLIGARLNASRDTHEGSLNAHATTAECAREHEKPTRRARKIAAIAIAPGGTRSSVTTFNVDRNACR